MDPTVEGKLLALLPLPNFIDPPHSAHGLTGCLASHNAPTYPTHHAQNAQELTLLHTALVTLTPLDESEDFIRVFTLNPTTDHLDVGRASKNESKALIAAQNNAWFDSPIISRHHAQFRASFLYKVRMKSFPNLFQDFLTHST